MESFLSIHPTIKALPYDEALWTQYMSQLVANRSKIPGASESVSGVLDESLKLVIGKFKSQASSAFATNTAYQHKKALDLIVLCLRTGHLNLTEQIFARLLDKSLLTANYIQKFLVPFLPEFRKCLQKENIAITSDPFRSIFKLVVLCWSEKVLGQKPGDQAIAQRASLQTLASHCHDCREVFLFLAQGTSKTRSWERIGAPRRKHLEQRLAMNASWAASWNMIRSTPQGITVRPQ
jgi:hypothetical protein